jgi:hypothetical protein
MEGLSTSHSADVSHAEAVVLVHGLNQDPVTQKQVELTARFYGLELKAAQVRGRAETPGVLSLLRNSETVAAIVSADALATLGEAEVIASLRRPAAGTVPLLILGVTQQTDPMRLATWSDGALTGSQHLPAGSSHGAYRFANVNGITKELSGEEMPALTRPACTFAIDTRRSVQPLLSLRVGQEDRPVFVWDNSDSKKTFFLADLNPADPSATPVPLTKAEDFLPLAPMMMFVRYAAGERAMHSDAQFANLIIDDPWLTEPYGHLNYEGLLEEMEKHNFHTTIAFIPWNFDRSEADLVQLFSRHPDRFSICMHGNNHNHREFGSYNENPLPSQVADIKQGLARMEEFQRLSKLPFDRFMIFPHDVASPLDTLRKFKEYNLLGAASRVTVPFGSNPPVDHLSSLRVVTADFAGFPLVRRYSAEASLPRWLIAINAFLGNPLLFYCHHTFFANGPGAFNSIAEAVNQIQPDVRWSSLGIIAQHLYLARVRSDTDYDALAFSREFILHNRQQRDVVFHVRKKEDGSSAIKSLTVDGQPTSYELSGGELHFTVLVSSGKAKHVVLEYQNDLNLASVDVSKKSLHVTFLRRLSDFRDITLARYKLGRAVTRFYYKVSHI